MALTESDIKIIIAAELKKAGFDKAQKATNALDKTFKRLGGTIASVFAAQQIVAFGKASVQAFVEDDRAARRLTQTFKNLGLAYDATQANDYIDALQRQTGVADTQLRPALETLIRTTLDYGKSQSILATAMDISAGSGNDLQSVTEALSKAYQGNFTSLARMNVGISQSEAKTISFDQAMAKLNSRFTGQAKLAAETYAGKIDRIKIAADEAQETIGKGLVTALEILSKDHSIDGLTSQMDTFAQSIAFASIGLADLLKPLTTKSTTTNRSIIDDLTTAFFGPIKDAYQYLVKRGQEISTSLTSAPSRGGAPGAQRLAAANAAILKKQLADQKKLAAAQAKAAAAQIKAQKDAAALKRAGTIFDMENIQIVAALQGRINEEQRTRLLALLAINTENADAADKLTQAILALQSPALKALGVTVATSDNASTVITKLIDAQTRLMLLNLGIANISEAKNPFASWDQIMAKILADLARIQASLQFTTTVTTVQAPVVPVLPVVPVPVPKTGGDYAPGVGGDNIMSAVARGEYSAAIDAIAKTAPSIPDNIMSSVARGEYANAVNAIVSGGNYPSTVGGNNIMSSVSRGEYSNQPFSTLASAGMGSISRGEYQNTTDLTGGAYTSVTAIPGLGGVSRNEYTVNVNVGGSIISESDLVKTLTDSLYTYQKTGKGLLTSPTAL